VYQLEVKASLVAAQFPPASNWTVCVDIDSMERCRGGKHPVGKKRRARAAERRLKALGARIQKHPVYGRADIVAEHPRLGTVVVEVEGSSARQREQALYSALGQIVLSMRTRSKHVRYALAVPDQPEWRRQLCKVPPHIASRLRLELLLVSEDGVRVFDASSSDV
jgi:hypothetical protein